MIERLRSPAAPISGDIADVRIDAHAFIGEAVALLGVSGGGIKGLHWDTAIVALVTATLGLPDDRRPQVEAFLRLLQPDLGDLNPEGGTT
jgi:hypothetical protein